MFKKGGVPWNKGKKGGVPWNKGKKGVHSGDRNPMFGKKHSSEAIEKMRLRKLGKIMPVGTGEKIRQHHLGKQHSIESRQKRSRALKGRPRPYLVGENNPAWKGGITPLGLKIRGHIKNEEWRMGVFERDNWTCQFCSQRGGDLEADHIKPFSVIVEEEKIYTFDDIGPESMLWDINNGRTLCIPCHKKTKTWGRRAKKTLKSN